MLNRPDAQIVFVDTPGHPQAPHRCSASGSTTPPTSAIGDVDVVCLVLDATAADRPGRPVRRRAGARPTPSSWSTRSTSPRRDQVLEQLRRRRRARAERVLPGVGHAPARACHALRRAPRRPPARGPAVLPRRHGHRRARGVLGGRAGARAAAGRHPRRAAALDRHPGDRVGVAPHPLRDPRRARVARRGS